MVKAGGGLLLDDADCTPDWVAIEIPALLHDDAPAQGMAAALAGVAPTDAATVLATKVLEVIG